MTSLDIDLKEIHFANEITNYFDENIELKRGVSRLLSLIEVRQKLQNEDEIPVILSTNSGSWIKANLVTLDGKELMTSEGPGSFMVHGYDTLKALYPPMTAV